jgi:UDP-N-acetylglucosamine 2-epimerase
MKSRLVYFLLLPVLFLTIPGHAQILRKPTKKQLEHKVDSLLQLTDSLQQILAGLLQSVDIAVELIKDGHHGIPVPDYVDENVSTKVVRIIQSYTGVVNKMVWRKF